MCIYFNNGGHLDTDHIDSGGELVGDGEATIISDRGYEYTITLD